MKGFMIYFASAVIRTERIKTNAVNSTGRKAALAVLVCSAVLPVPGSR
jgi:hypothetical protein